MTLKECYEAMNGSYEEILARFRKEERIVRFMLKFPGDPSFANLKQALEQEDNKAAFLAAHSIKGVSQNLGFTELYECSRNLTEALRPEKNQGIDQDIFALVQKVEKSYHQTVSAIQAFQTANESMEG